MVSTQQAAAVLQRRVTRDETTFRARPGAREALKRLQTASEAVVYRIGGERVDLLFGRKLGGRGLGATRDVATVQEFVDLFYREHGAVFSGSPLPEGSLRVERVKSASTTVAEVRQYIDDLPVTDARWTLLFDRDGHLTHVLGTPFDPAKVTVGRRPVIDVDQAVALALEHESLDADEVNVSAHLAIEGRTNQLLWTVELSGRRSPSLSPMVVIDAHHRTVLARRDRVEHAVVEIPVTHYTHPLGVKDSTGRTTTSDIVIDSVAGVFPFSLQRLGSGRSRIWNARLPGARPFMPEFSRTFSSDPDYFQKRPGLTDHLIFNEQQTYYWSQTLKTAVDEWGRQPNDYGYYPVDLFRALNVEIVVNGDATMEPWWKPNMSVFHGYFRKDAPGTWFSNPALTVPAVFLFNSIGNTASPQFFGPEFSGSYSIIAHEVGHFISWQYGGWLGPAGTNLEGSLNEGHSMVLAALLGKACFGAALEWDESEFVTTGGTPQWKHTPKLKYSDMQCKVDDDYDLAHPFVQAMWRLMNNLDVDGAPIWGSTDAAISNTADLFMYSLFCFTADSTMTWDKLCLALLTRVHDRIEDRLEKEPLPNTWCAVSDVFSDHGLLEECTDSP